LLLADLVEFATRHRACGQLTGDATEPVRNGYLLTVGCSCGVEFMRWVTPEEALREMVLPDVLVTTS
jgi:hypothetical protein